MRMDLSHWLAAGAILGVVAACWAKIKAVCWRFCSIGLHQVSIQDELTQTALVDYLITHYKQSRFYDKLYGSANEHTIDGKFGLVPFELLGKRSILFWNGWFPFVYAMGSKPQPTGNNTAANNAAAQGNAACTLTFLRGTMNAEQLIKDACDARNTAAWDVDYRHKERQRRFFIKHVPAVNNAGTAANAVQGNSTLAWYQQSRYRLLKHKPHELGKHITARRSPLEDLIFPQRVKELIREIRLWRNHKAWYQERGIPWKRGWLCFGPPGTGKTALARAFAEELDMPLFVYNLAELGNFELMKAWAEMQAAAPCVALIEDIDNVFHGRENVVRRPGVFPRRATRTTRTATATRAKARRSAACRSTRCSTASTASSVRRASSRSSRRTTSARWTRRWASRDACPTAPSSSSARAPAASTRRSS